MSTWKMYNIIMSSFYLLLIVDRCSKTQLQVGKQNNVDDLAIKWLKVSD